MGFPYWVLGHVEVLLFFLSQVLMEKLSHWQEKNSGVSIVDTFHEFQLHIISSYKTKVEVLGPVA